MDRLSVMFDAKQFAAAFGAARDGSSSARGEPDAVVWLEGGVGVAGAGLSWGHGQVTFQGSNHCFRVSRLSIADVGSASIYATGRIMRLRRIADFCGNYRPLSTGTPMAADSFATCLQNEHGVVIQLVATDTSTGVDRPLNSVRVRLKHG